MPRSRSPKCLAAWREPGLSRSNVRDPKGERRKAPGDGPRRRVTLSNSATTKGDQGAAFDRWLLGLSAAKWSKRVQDRHQRRVRGSRVVTGRPDGRVAQR